MESKIKISEGEIFLRHNQISQYNETLLFIHGLGESSLCFREVMQDVRFINFNILIPDMLGYGRSSIAVTGDYSFNSQVARIWEIINIIDLKDVYVVGHSVGGDLGTILCNTDSTKVIKKFVNIEGDITQYDDFITREGMEAESINQFEEWFFNRYMNDLVLNQWSKDSLACKRYYESLKLCQPEAFRANVKELYKLKNFLAGKYKSQLGETYTNLDIEKVFCYGSKSIDQRSVQFLKDKNLSFKEFDAGHWVMIDQSEQFYQFLIDFIQIQFQ